MREPPGAGKPHAGKYGELTPLRQRGGAGESLPLTHFSIVKTEKSGYSTAELAAIATFIHNCYSSTLRWDELKPLVEDLEKTLKRFRSEIYSFIDKHD
jgi:hypothetical protein